MKAHICHRGRLRADIDDLDLTEYREVADEAIEPRTDIDVPLRLGVMDPPCDMLILIEVSPQRTAAFVPLGEHGQLAAPGQGIGPRHAPEGLPVAQIPRPVA